VRNLAAALDGHPLAQIRAISIGPVTSEAVREHGFQLLAEARQHDLDGLVETIVAELGNRQPA
jgi:uroporphyrinogen-III synthase